MGIGGMMVGKIVDAGTAGTVIWNVAVGRDIGVVGSYLRRWLLLPVSWALRSFFNPRHHSCRNMDPCRKMV